MTYPPPPPNDPYGNQPPPPPYGGPGNGAPAYGPQGGYGAPAVAYATWIQRVGAYLIDMVIYGVFIGIGVIVGRGTDDAGLPTVNAFYYVFLLLGLIVLGYNRWYLAGKTGQSWGKKALGIRLVSERTGQPIGAGLAFVRDLAHFIDGIICYIGYLFPLWDAKKQTISDKIMNTLVVTA